MSAGLNTRDKKIFLPLTTNKNLWDVDAAMIFLNQIYCEQLDEAEKKNLHYSVCNAKLPVKDQVFQNTIKEIAACIGKVVNVYSNTHEDREYWEKIFFRWLLYSVYDVQVKILQFENIKKNHPDRIFYTYTKNTLIEKDFFEGGTNALWEDDYHLWLYTYLAKNHFGIQVKSIELKEAPIEPLELMERKKTILRNIYCKIKKLYAVSPQYILRKGRACFYRFFFRGKAEVLYYCLDISGDTSLNWAYKSAGKIQQIRMPSMNINVPRISSLREKVIAALREVRGVSPVVADVIGRTLPKLYLEEYKYHHKNSLSFLKAHKRLKIIFSTTGILSPCKETIFSLLAQKRGVKIIGFQHGGDYEFVKGIFDQEEYLNDSFYSWAREDVSPWSSQCRIFSGPSYKFDCYRGMQFADQYILFVGTTLFMYPRYDEYRGEDAQKIRYIRRQIEFFSALEKKTRETFCVKEYYVDSGWHIVSKIKKIFPTLRFLGSEKTASSYGIVDIVDRNMSFTEALAKCKLMICDHLSTTWREALYLNKPFILLLDSRECCFRKEALDSVHLMESVGIIRYDCEETATLLNQIHENVSSWWNEPERQKVVRKIRHDYQVDVDDIDGWWVQELLRQARS